jgi:hypothetical protein
MFVLYFAITSVWAWLCYKNMQDLLPIQVSSYSTLNEAVLTASLQYYLSSLFGLLIIEMVANWGTLYLTLL